MQPVINTALLVPAVHAALPCFQCAPAYVEQKLSSKVIKGTGLQVIVALSVRGRDHIPYRSSKLTHVLKDSLGGNCKTLMVACIWSEAAQLEETTSTCRSASPCNIVLHS